MNIKDLEDAVINAAIAMRQKIPGTDIRERIELEQAAYALITGCGACNTDTHRCPGCGAPVPHAGSGVCSNCAPLVAGASSTRVDGTEAHEPPREQQSAFTKAVSGEPNECLCSRTERMYCHREDCHGGTDVPDWVMRTWLDVRAGDIVRLPGTEHIAKVVSAVRLPWHVHPAANQYRPHEMPAEWSAVRVRFASDDVLRDMDPSKPVEILLSPSEVAAIEALGGWANRLNFYR